MKTANWTFDSSSEFDFMLFYQSLVDYWLSPSVNRSVATTAIRNIAQQSRAGKKLLEKCLPVLSREVHASSDAERSGGRRALALLYNEIELAVKGRTISKVHVSLPERGNFRSTSKSPLAEVGAPGDHDRRHVFADFFSKNFIQDLLNSLRDGDQQCDYLCEVGCDPDNFGGSIQQAARKWQLNMFNHLDNLFMGPAQENRSLGARGVAIDPAPWQLGLRDIIRRDLTDILGTRQKIRPLIALDIEQRAIQALMKAPIR